MKILHEKGTGFVFLGVRMASKKTNSSLLKCTCLLYVHFKILRPLEKKLLAMINFNFQLLLDDIIVAFKL